MRSLLCCALAEGTAAGACLPLHRCPSGGLSGRLRLRLSRFQASAALGAPRSSGSGSTLSRSSPGDTADVGSAGVRGSNAIQAQSHGLHEEGGPQAAAFRPELKKLPQAAASRAGSQTPGTGACPFAAPAARRAEAEALPAMARRGERPESATKMSRERGLRQPAREARQGPSATLDAFDVGRVLSLSRIVVRTTRPERPPWLR